jgi:DinB superfamily
MDIFEYIKRQMAGVRRMVDMTMKDMTPELFNWATPGTANTISATFIHFMSVEDNFIQAVIQGKPRVWDSGGWSEKTGVQKTPSIGENWDEFKHRQVAIQPLLDYKTAVWAATDAYLATLTEEELDRKVKFAGGERTVADMLLMSMSQSLSHNGEIAALKGVQGAKGLSV